MEDSITERIKKLDLPKPPRCSVTVDRKVPMIFNGKPLAYLNTFRFHPNGHQSDIVVLILQFSEKGEGNGQISEPISFHNAILVGKKGVLKVLEVETSGASIRFKELN